MCACLFVCLLVCLLACLCGFSLVSMAAIQHVVCEHGCVRFSDTIGAFCDVLLNWVARCMVCDGLVAFLQFCVLVLLCSCVRICRGVLRVSVDVCVLIYLVWHVSRICFCPVSVCVFWLCDCLRACIFCPVSVCGRCGNCWVLELPGFQVQ